MDIKNERNLTMLFDFYELTMANGYFKNGIGEKTAYFDMFFIIVSVSDLVIPFCKIQPE